MFFRHSGKLLSAHIDGELDPQTDSRVASHLEQCERCRRRHARILAGARWAEALPAVPAPAELLAEIERRIAASAPVVRGEVLARSRLRWAFAAIPIVIAALLWTLISTHRTQRTEALELRNYFESVAKARPEKLVSAIAAAPSGFAATRKGQALREAGIGRETVRDPLEHFELVAQRSRPTPRAVATELVYSADGEAFSVFVVPRSLPVRPSARELAESSVSGALCHKLEPSCATVVWFSGGRFQCVLVSTFDDPRRIASIIDFFRSAHEAEAQSTSG